MSRRDQTTGIRDPMTGSVDALAAAPMERPLGDPELGAANSAEEAVAPPVEGSLGDEAAVLELMPPDEALDVLQQSDTPNDETFAALDTHEPVRKKSRKKTDKPS